VKEQESGSTTARKAGGLDFIAEGSKRQGREVHQIVEKDPAWKTQLNLLKDDV